MLDEIKETLKIASEEPKRYDETRQQWIDTSSQKVDDVVTGGLQKINMPGAEFIGDRARNITGFAQDMTIPESWEIPLLAGGAAIAAAEPTPFGEALVGLKYGTGVTSRAYRAGKKVLKKPIAVGTAMAANIVDDAFSRANSLFNRNNSNWRLATPDNVDVNPNIMQSTTKGGGKKVGSGQLNLIFPHEVSITKPRRGASLIGEEIELIADKSRGLKTRKFIKQDINYNNYRLSNGSYDIDRFERNIRDLLEADQIRAIDVPIGQLHKVKGTTKALKKTVGADAKTIESLYGDYLAGYFNTYGNLDNVARLSTPSGKIVPNVNRDLIRNLRLFRMNPELFYSGGREAFNPKIRTGTYNSQLKQIITENKTTKQFIEGTKLQRHHLAVIDEVWPLFDGLIGNDVDRMRNALKDLDIFVGNDPKNLSLVPKQFHNSIVHDVLWKAFRPSWAGRTGKTKALQLDIKNMNFQERVNAGFVDEFKESMDIINRQLDLGIKEFINRKGNVNSKNINELKDFLQTIVDIDMDI